MRRAGSKVVAIAASGATRDYSMTTARDRRCATAERASYAQTIAMKAIGVTPEYIGAMRARDRARAASTVASSLGLRAVGVTPEYARDAGCGRLPVDRR